MRITTILLCLLLATNLCGKEVTGRVFSFQNQFENLPGKSINSIVQDSLGFLWIGTENGASIFDGYTCNSIEYTKDNPIYSPSNNFFKKIYRDSKQRMWIGMDKGVCIYSGNNTAYVSLKAVENHYIRAFMEDNNKNIWIGTNAGIYIVSEDLQQFHQINELENKESSGKRANFIRKDNKGNIWFISDYGLHQVSIYESKKKVVNYDFSKQQQLSVKSYPIKGRIGFFMIDKRDRIWISVNNTAYIMPLPDDQLDLNTAEKIADNEEHLCIYQDSNDNIWIGTRDAGISYLEMDSSGNIIRKERIWMDKEHSYHIANTINTIFGDKWGNIWVGTKNGMYASKLIPTGNFREIKEGDNDQSLTHNNISDFYQDSKRNIWIAGSYGLNKFTWIDRNKSSYKIKHYYDTHDRNRMLQNNRFQTLIEKEDGLFWLGTKNSLICFDSHNGTFYEDKRANQFQQENDLKLLRTSFKDSKNNIWLGYNEGLAVYIPELNDFRLVGEVDDDLIDNDYWDITEDARGMLWIGCRKKGLFKIKVNTDALISNSKEAILYKKQFLPDEWITCIHVNKDNIPWVGTAERVYRYDPVQEDFIEIPFLDINRTTYISAILEDANDAIWICTTKGVYKYDEKQHNAQYYEIKNGNLARKDYVFGKLISDDGSIFLGGINGVTYFRPEDLKPDTTKQEIIITDFQILNKKVTQEEHRGFEGNINNILSLTLSHLDYQFLFEFSTLYLTDPHKIKYSYMLEGFDKDWIYCDARHNYASYTNLPAGNYTLKIRSTNASGIWQNNEKTIQIKVLPPPWKSWWAYCIYSFLFLLVFGIIFYIVYIRSMYRQQELSKQWKNRFYTNVIAGFETPLFLLRAPLDSLLQNIHTTTKTEIEDMLKIMQQNVKRLSHLTKQLLEFQKTDMGKASLSLSQIDMIPFINNIHLLFKDIADSKNIDFKFQHKTDSIPACIDSEKMEIVLFNLLSNAFKYTPENGLVMIQCYQDVKEDKIWIEVYDNGTGIEKQHLQEIFQSFYYLDNKPTTPLISTGTGLGLSLAKDFIELHKGKLSVESVPEKGSIFRFFLPVNVNIGETSIVQEKRTSNYTENYIDIEKEIETSISRHKSKSDMASIFFVEGNDEVKVFLEKVLQKHNYQVKTFQPDDSVFNFAVKQEPALILYDTNEENLSKDLATCKKLKDNIQTCHIPVVLLLENNSTENNVKKGHEVGADACILKPFEISYLMIRIKQLMDIRQSIRKKVKMEEFILSEKEKLTTTSIDDKFLKKIMDITEKNISDENFSLEEFAKQVGISRSVLNTRIQNLLGQTPIEFVKTTRLKKAALLLESNAYNIAEISLMVGFTDAGYFSTCFKKQFGATPSEYLKSRKKN